MYKQKTIRSKVISWWSPARPHFVGWWSHWDHHSQLSTGAHLRPTVQKDVNTRTNVFLGTLCSLTLKFKYTFWLQKNTKGHNFVFFRLWSTLLQAIHFRYQLFCHTLIYVTPLPKLEITDLEVGWVPIFYTLYKAVQSGLIFVCLGDL